MNFSINDIVALSGAELISSCEKEENIRQIYYDTRRISHSSEAIFIALKGENNGHEFIEEAYKKGIRTFMVEEDIPFLGNDSNVLKVNNSLLALSLWAKNYRKKFTLPVVMICGSYGKTSIKEWAFHLLSGKYTCLKSPKSYNSKLGVALSILKLNSQHEIALIEAGISHPNEMEHLVEVIQPSHVLFSNIGRAHLENFESENELIKEKLKAFHSDALKISSSKILQEHQIEGIAYSPNPKYESELPFQSDWKNNNYLAAVKLAELFELDQESIRNRSKSLPQIAHRLERLDGINGSTIINDSYILDPESLSIAISDFSALKFSRSFLVISDLDSPNKAAYQEIENTIRQKEWAGIYVLGGAMASNLYKLGIHSFAHPQQIINDLKKHLEKGDGVLIKGARKYELENIARALAEVKHKSYLEVNLSQLGRNLKTCRALLPKGVKQMAMVKALSYGSGSGELAQYLEKNNIDYFGVAFSEEGKALRQAGITTPIMVLNTSEESFESIWENQLEPVIFSLEILDEFIRFCMDKKAESYPIHLEFDTGMKRLGFSSEQCMELIETIKAQPEVKIQSVFTHLAAADLPKEDAFTRKQLELFDRLANLFKSSFSYPILAHCHNSAGASRFKNYAMDMVRLGISLYGYNPLQSELKPISGLYSSLSQIKELKKGETLGYNRSFTAEKDMIIGILPIGYADGLSRSLSNGVGKVFANGRFFPIIGMICMDMCMVEIDEDITTDTEFEIFGDHISLYDLADKMNTIPYEVLTSISFRVKRVFVQD